MPSLFRTVIWQSHDPPGAEYFGLWRDGDGWQLRGTVIVPLDGVPARVRYGVICDADWRTRAVHIALRLGSEEQALHVTADGTGSWQSGGQVLAQVQGCVDIDLEVTPATNTLPIRRLSLPPGSNADATAAWVRFPTLTVEPLEQTYARVGEQRFLYQCGTAFSADIEVDSDGLVTRYGDLWSRVASHDLRR